MHDSLAEGLGKIGVLLLIHSDKNIDTTEIGKNICMHIAASNPIAKLQFYQVNLQLNCGYMKKLSHLL